MKQILTSVKTLALLAACLPWNVLWAQAPDGGATELTPSRSEYFSWINNTNEGATEAHTLTNLNFFDWMRRTYGMQLDIYAFDAGAIDGARFYGSMDSERFRRQFPNGFGPVAQRAGEIGTRLGIWGGPDGFGDTPEEAQKRIDMMCSLVEKYNFWLFKMDAVCGQLPASKHNYFIEMMQRVRRASPDFVLLNHRLNLGEGTKYSTTYLLGGAETYVDVFLPNRVTAPHHRASTIGRESPKGLTRLTEDHGVCISSCLDGWDDDLVLQAFARNLILAPEIYGSPWLLRDDEFPRLAFIFNLHRRYRDILVRGMQLPQESYGPEAVSRGNESTRFLALRNLSWEPVKYKIRLDEEVGLSMPEATATSKSKPSVQVRQYHPFCLDLGAHTYGSTIELEVLPFRAALVKLTCEAEDDRVLVSGAPYYIICDKEGQEAEVQLLGLPSTRSTATVTSKHAALSLDGQKVGNRLRLRFDGTPLTKPYHRHVAEMTACDIPADASSLYYATAFAADNNCLEVRSLQRSGTTQVPEVQAARDAFFQQQTLVDRGVWDRYLFDGDPQTGFAVDIRHRNLIPGNESAMLIDLGEVQQLDSLVIDIPSVFALAPYKVEEGNRIYLSADLVHWEEVTYLARLHQVIDTRHAAPFRYARLRETPGVVSEMAGFKDGRRVNNEHWHVNNLMRDWRQAGLIMRNAWKATFTIDEAAPGAYLCIAVNGRCGWENAWAALKVDGHYVGCPDRAPSYPSNVWEHRLAMVDGNYTFYVPVTPDMIGRPIEAYAMTIDGKDIKPEVWLTAHDIPFLRKTLKLQ